MPRVTFPEAVRAPARPLAPVLLLLLCVSLPPTGAARLGAGDWPQWRGPSGDGLSPETGLPLEWDREKGVLWRLDLPGPAGATPVIHGDRIFLTSESEGDVVLIAASTDGRLLWTRPLGSGNRNVRGDEGNSASPSPVTDGKHVWTLAGTGDLACHDRDGERVWHVDLQELHGKYDFWFGYTPTPLLDRGTLYLPCLRMKDPYLVAIDAATGKTRWKVDRPSDADFEARHSYASPLLLDDGKRRLLLIHGADYLTAHRLEDGREVWRFGGLNPRDEPRVRYNRTLRFVASPVVAKRLIVVPTAKKGRVAAVMVDSEATGDITATHRLWKLDERATPDVPTPVVDDGLLYLMREDGILICVEAPTGRILYRERLHPGIHRASPIVADGRVYCAARDGTVNVVAAGREFRRLASNAMEEPMSSTPAIAGGRIYLRTYRSLWAIGKAAN